MEIDNASLTGAPGVLAVNDGWKVFESQRKIHGPISIQVLKEPKIENGQIVSRGILLCGNEVVDDLVERHGQNFRSCWFIICTTLSHRISDSLNADLHMFSNIDAVPMYLESKAGKVPYINVSCGMFIDSDFFSPDTSVPKENDVLYVVKWFPTKRIELLLEAMLHFKKMRSVAILTIPVPTSTMLEISNNYRKKLETFIQEKKLLVKIIQAPDGVHKHSDGTFVPGGFMPEEMRQFYNQSRMTVLLSDYDEGINRSMCESMSCNLPVLITTDLVGGSKYLVNSRSGVSVRSAPASIASGIEQILDSKDDFSPREEFTSKWGMANSMRRLAEKIQEVAEATHEVIDTTNLRNYNGGPWTMDYYDIVEKLTYL
jgi:glycosyltransferase involved in cell wall biosynthesis